MRRGAQLALGRALRSSPPEGVQLLQRRYDHASELVPVGALAHNLALRNTGLKAGPGGRSSVSGVTATVFGCTGFLGRYVVNALARQGSQVVVPYRCDDLECQYLRQMGDLGQVVSLKDFNVFDEGAVRRAVSRSNVVINLLGADRETWNFSFDDVHVRAAAIVARAAAEAPGVEHLVHLSHLAAAPAAASQRLRTKAEGEESVKAAFPDATILKPAVMVGTEDSSYNTYAQLIKRLPRFPLFGGGRARLQPVYVRDVADALLKTLATRGCLGKTYHLAGPETITEREMVELVYDTLRESRRVLPLPLWLGELAARPREALFKKVPVPVNTYFTLDAIRERQQDQVLPQGVLGFADLGLKPQKVLSGIPLEHIRHMRVGGYDLGTLSAPDEQ